MALNSLICPHCGSSFELDPSKALQSYWICPYCGNRSLMQKTGDSIRLRGIIPGKFNSQEDAPPTGDLYPEMPLAEQGQVIETQPAPRRSLAEIIAEAESMAPSNPAPAPTFTQIWPAATEPVEKTAFIPAEAESPKERPVQAASKSEPEPIRPAIQADEIPEQPVMKKNGKNPELDRICEQAKNAALDHNLPLFNCYSRQAIDLAPEDPRIYALRTILTEEAEGFAKATWSAPFWNYLTPRRKRSALAQHLYNFNTALRFSPDNQREELIQRFARLIVHQAVDYFTEQAELRCKQNLILKTFNGHYKRKDLYFARYFIEAIHLIDQTVCPLADQNILFAVRAEILLLPHRIAKRFRSL